VGFPRESITWRACTRVIFVDIILVSLLGVNGDFTEKREEEHVKCD